MSRPYRPKIVTSYYSSSTTTKTTTTSQTKPSNTPTQTSSNTSNTITEAKYNELLAKFNDYVLKSSLNDLITQQDLNTAIANIKNTPTNTITEAKYNELLAKFNDYALKASLNGFTTQQELNTAIASIKQCNCENQTTTPVDNNALSALIQKLNNYGIFNYDVPGKETIVTEFFPHLASNSSGTYYDGTMPYCFDGSWQVLLVLASNENAVNDFDFVYIQTPNGNKTINSLSLAKYFIKYSEKQGSYNYIVSKDILNEPVTITNNKGIKSIKLTWSWSALRTAANYTSTNPSDPLNYDGPTEMYVEFAPATNDTKNGINCAFDGGYGGTGHYIYGGTITLTLPENISLVNNLPNGSYTITANGNKITIKLFEEDANGNLIRYYGAFTKQIIIADSATKRYVIKLNGEPEALPPEY